MGAARADGVGMDGCGGVVMSKYSDEERDHIREQARAAIADADAVLDKPRPELAEWPPCESRSQKYRREAREQEERFAAERAKSEPLTEWQAANLEHRLAGLSSKTSASCWMSSPASSPN
jgi:hypothetical protein